MKILILIYQAWEDEDEEDEEDDDDGEEDEDEEDDEEDDEDDNASDDAMNDGSDPASFTYQDGLPTDPILPLAFTNRSFLNAARSLLYGRQIILSDMYQASLFLRTLQNSVLSSHNVEPEADTEVSRQRQSLPYLVRHVAVDVRKTISLGRGGGSLLINIIHLCPRLETFLCSPDWMRTAFVPLQKALSGCSEMKAIALRGGTSASKELVWTTATLEPLLSKWTHLEGSVRVARPCLCFEKTLILTTSPRLASAATPEFAHRHNPKTTGWPSEETFSLSFCYRR